jgi:hypothetical protein
VLVVWLLIAVTSAPVLSFPMIVRRRCRIH